MSKKTNPRRMPVSQADVNRAKAQAADQAVAFCWTLLFTVLRDKCGFKPEQLRRTWNACEKLADEITEGRVSLSDLATVLREEAGLTLSKG